MAESRLLIKRGEGFPKNDPHRFFLESLVDLRNYAREAAKLAYSYRERPVRVGAAVFSIVEGTDIWAITVGYNTKVEGKDKNCAEPKAFDTASEQGMNRAIGLVVVSNTGPQENADISGAATLNLPPCSVCHGDFLCDPVARDDMIIVTGSLDHDIVQANTASRFRSLQLDPECPLDVFENQFGGLDTQRLLQGYDILQAGQRILPLRRRLSSVEIAIGAILTQGQAHV